MKYPVLPLALIALGLSACAGLTGPVIMGADATGIYTTRPAKPPPADVADQIPPHQVWCYRTIGEPQCFAHPQDVLPERLINVDPQNAYPVDLQAYRQALIAKPAAVTVVAPAPAIVMTAPDQPAMVQPASVSAPDIQVEKATLKDEISGGNAEAAAPEGTPQPAMSQPEELTP